MGKKIYSYLIAGLPELAFMQEVKGFVVTALLATIEEQLDDKDRKLLRRVVMGLNNPTPYFYSTAAKSVNLFIRDYFAFDCMLRNAQCLTAAKKMNIVYQSFYVGEETKEPMPDDMKQALELPNVLEREQRLDMLRWNKVNDITVFNYLDIERILAFVVKAFITERWVKMDKTTGAELFDKLLNELSSTAPQRGLRTS